jgi:hypothetical protein
MIVQEQEHDCSEQVQLYMTECGRVQELQRRNRQRHIGACVRTCMVLENVSKHGLGYG